MRDDKLGKIYKLHILGNEELVYYGSTMQSLGARLSGHKRTFKRWKNGKSAYITSFKLLEIEGVVITLVEKYPWSCRYELASRGRWWIENNKCVNKCVPTRTIKEWYKVNTDKMKEYYKANIDKIKEYRKANANKIKNQKKEYNLKNKKKIAKHKKEYYKNNADKYKAHYQNNKESILQKLKEKVKCEFCGSSVRKDGLRKHQKSKKCRKFQNNI